jgi:ribonuclease P protein component
MPKLLADHLRKRADFLRAQRGIRRSAAGLTLEICATPEPAAKDGRFRVGFTASRKVGGAVARNRAKRRLRAAAQAVLPDAARQRTDYVLIARPATLARPFADLLKDLAQTLAAAHVRLTQPEGADQRDTSR